MLRGEVSHLIHPMQATFTLKEYTFHTLSHTSYELRSSSGRGGNRACGTGTHASAGGGRPIDPRRRRALSSEAGKPRKPARDTLHLPLWMASE